MKKIKHLLLVLMLTLSLTTPATVPVIGTATPVSAAARTSISNKSITLYKGNSKQLKIKGTSKKVKWSSKNRRIATVSSKGKVTAKAPGRTQIIAKAGKNTYTCKVIVKVKQTSRPGIQSYVWLSATGRCYHRIPNCGRMNPNRARKIPISQARNSGYSPCRKCF